MTGASRDARPPPPSGAGCGIIGVTSGSRAPVGTEEKLAGFTELLGTAIINAQAQAELAASRARIVAVGDTPAARSSAICMTAPSSGWSLSACS
jgi:hypothetical protein